MPAPKQFLFVNKTADSKSLSNNRSGGLSYTQINRQAQLVAKSRSKKPKRTQVAGKTAHVVGWIESPSPSSCSPLTPPTGVEPVVIKQEDDETGAEDSRFDDPIPAFDSVCSSVVTLDKTKQHVLEYFLNVWMPSKGHIPPGCQITGLTPVRPNDAEIAFHVVRGAFQTNDDVSMYALLTAGSRRMQILHNQTLARRDFPDLYTFKAIQALRKRIQRAEPPSQRLILDLSFLILAELFTPSPTRSEIYWHMMRSLVISCGGLQCLSTFTAQIAMGFDHHISAGTLSKPALDPFAYPELLGIKPSAQLPQQESQQRVMDMLEQLDARIRLIALETHALTLLVEVVRQFPQEAVDGVVRCLRAHVRQLYGVICQPLCRSGGSERAQSGPNVITADGMYMHARISTWRTWVWYAALSFLPYTDEAPVPILPPLIVRSEVTQTWKSIGMINQLLQGTGWMIRRDLLFWIAAVGFFAVTADGDRRKYRRLLQITAFELEIHSLQQLRNLIDDQFPLELMDPAADLKLWDALLDSEGDTEQGIT